MRVSCAIAAGLTCLLGWALPGRAAGEVNAGRAIFDGKGGCRACHGLDQRGGRLGPDLDEVGLRRSRASLQRALTQPEAEIAAGYLTIVAETSRGERVAGVRLNEDDLSIQLRDRDGNLRSFLKSSLKDLHEDEKSLMPSFAAKLTAAEIDQLVAFLATLKGRPLPARPRTRTIAPVSENLAWLTRPERDQDEQPEALLDALEIRPGAAVADLGAGTGFLTWRLARRVGPQGKVLAVDLQQSMLDRIAADLQSRQLSNVRLVLGEEDDPKLPAASLDLVLIANAYHEFSKPEAMMTAVRRSLRPGGRLAVIEYRKEEAYTPVPSLHQMTLEDLRSEVEPLGFQLERIFDFLPSQHGLVFSRRP